jgi:hypothetical protein
MMMALTKIIQGVAYNYQHDQETNSFKLGKH